MRDFHPAELRAGSAGPCSSRAARSSHRELWCEPCDGPVVPAGVPGPGYSGSRWQHCILFRWGFATPGAPAGRSPLASHPQLRCQAATLGHGAVSLRSARLAAECALCSGNCERGWRSPRSQAWEAPGAHTAPVCRLVGPWALLLVGSLGGTAGPPPCCCKQCETESHPPGAACSAFPFSLSIAAMGHQDEAVGTTLQKGPQAMPGPLCTLFLLPPG